MDYEKSFNSFHNYSFVMFFIGGPKDGWICVGGERVQHGMPSAPVPTLKPVKRIILRLTGERIFTIMDRLNYGLYFLRRKRRFGI